MRTRSIATFAVVLCLFVRLCAPVFAQDTPAVSIDDLLINSCTYGETVSLESVYITSDALNNTYMRLMTEGLLPWYVSGTFLYDVLEDSQRAVSFTPTYIYDGNIDQALYEQRAAEILNECVYEGMTQWQIALSLHDYLIANIAYDESLEKNTGYDGLVNGSTICAGYALLYQDLLQRVGIQCKYVTSEKMNHGWNMVCIDDQWYHVDLTWDDPTPNVHGQVCHDFFLLTDAEISAGEEPHYDWDVTTACTDTRFSNAFWRGVNSQICYESNSVCYLVRTNDYTNSIYRRDDSANKETRLYTEDTNYTNIGQGDYKYPHVGLSRQADRLYFTSLEKIRSMNTDGTNLKTEYSYDAKSNHRYIQGSHITGGTAYLSVSDHGGNPKTLTISVTPSQDSHTHSYTASQVSADCLNDGYTLSKCSCGLEAKSDLIKAAGHSYKIADQKKATVFDSGWIQWICGQCQDTYTEETARLTFVDILKNYGSYILSGGVVLIVLLAQGAKVRKGGKAKV